MTYEVLKEELKIRKTKYELFFKYLPSFIKKFILKKLNNNEQFHENQRKEYHKRYIITLSKNDELIDLIKKYKEFNEYLTSISKENYDKTIKLILDEILNLDSNYLLKSEVKNLEMIHKNITIESKFLQEYNPLFIKKERERYKDFFSGKEHNIAGLDSEQIVAVITNDTRNLVIAGAGSGKTRVLAFRIAYLLKKDTKSADKILALSYSKESARIITERLKDYFGIDYIKIKTFHSLGYEIIENNEGKRPQGYDPQKSRFIENKLDEALQNNEFKSNYFKFLTLYYDDDVEEKDFNEKEEYVKYLKEKRKWLTLKGEEVDSQAEKKIADFLFLNNIKYKHTDVESGNWANDNPQKKKYEPDFFLPDYNDLFIEHWGIDEEGNVPDWFSVSSEWYRKKMEWAQNRFKEENKRLIETFEYEFRKDDFEEILRKRLKKEKVKFEPLTYEVFINEVYDYNHIKKKIFDIFTNFIQNAKVLNLTYEEILEKVDKTNKKQYYFSLSAIHFLELYNKMLSKKEGLDLIDYADMIHKTDKIINNNPKKYLQTYEHILVDEFQDISDDRVKLLKTLLKNENARLFCVGDDWQGIYAFNGSDIDYTINFDKYFGKYTPIKLRYNYRNPSDIVNMGNDLIEKNKNKTDKKIVPKKEVNCNPKMHILPNYNSNSYERYLLNYIISILDELINTKKVKSEDIMVLCRYNKYFDKLKNACSKINAQFEEKKDGKIIRKGIKFYSAHASKGTESNYVIIMDVITDKYGFPSQLEDKKLLDPVRMNKEKGIDEERRLFYVAITRAEKELHITTKHKNKSIFITEIEEYLEKNKIVTPDRIEYKYY